MAAPAFHESLPYIDTPSESSLARARALVAQEAQATPRGGTTKPVAPEPAFSEAMQTELARVASSGPAAAREGGRGAGARPRVHVGGVPARAAAEPGAAGEARRAGVAPVELPPRGGAGAGRGRARPDKGRGGRGE
ncbi:Breast carcinoma amplified sequence 2, partial [Metarhizium majus ARSEF 297]